MQAHDGYAEHSHEVRSDHLGVKCEPKPPIRQAIRQYPLNADELLRLARAATYEDRNQEATDYWLILDIQASRGNLPEEWQH